MHILERYRGMGFHKLADRIEFLLDCKEDDDKLTEQMVVDLYNMLVSLVKLPDISLTLGPNGLVSQWKIDDKSIVVYLSGNEESKVVVLNKGGFRKPPIGTSESVNVYDLGEWLLDKGLV